MTQIHDDAWLAEMIARRAFRVVAGADDSVEPVAAHVREQTRAFYFTKVDTRHVALVARLGEIGFFCADTNVLFEHTRPSQTRPPDDVLVRRCTPNDSEGVLSIGGSAYKYSRFHLDPLFSVELAHHIKREWVRSYVQGKRGDHLFVALRDGRPVGFLAALVANAPKRAVIDLIGVEPESQGRHIGVALVHAFVEHYAGYCLQVGTQVANIPSVKFYERQGFSLLQSQYVLHLHAESGRPKTP